MSTAASLTRAPRGRAGAPALEAGSSAERYQERKQHGASNTRRARAADLRSFEAFCAEQGTRPYPASLSILANYAAHLADLPRKFATIQRHLASIQREHRQRRLRSAAGTPALLDVMQGIALGLGTKQRQAPAFSVDYLKACVQRLDLGTSAGLRDRALLLLGFAGAFRRSELVAINIEHLLLSAQDLLIRLDRSKTNQKGAAEEKAFFFGEQALYCPIRACQDWLGQLAGRTTGPLFVRLTRGQRAGQGTASLQRLSAAGVNKLVGQHLGVNAEGQRYTAHSFRSSFVTAAKLAGQSNDFIRNQTKHKTDTILSRYTRLTDVRTYNAGKALGL